MSGNTFKTDFLTRQADIIPVLKLGIPIDIIGCGSLGSTTALWLARMGCYNLRLWDSDVVAPENLNCQSFNLAQIDVNKAVATQENIKAAMGFNVVVRKRRFESGCDLRRLVVVCVDSMSARAMIYKEILATSKPEWLVEARMGAEKGNIFVLNRYDDDACENYAKTLYSDNAATSDPCTAKSTGYNALLLASVMVKAVKDIIVDSPYIIKEYMTDTAKNWDHTFLRNENARS